MSKVLSLCAVILGVGGIVGEYPVPPEHKLMFAIMVAIVAVAWRPNKSDS